MTSPTSGAPTARAPDILEQIIAHKRGEVAAARATRPLAAVQAAAAKAPPPRDFLAALRDPRVPRIIAECKRQSPSRGLIAPDYDPVRLAGAYERGGAAAISVLTDERFFGGTLADLVAVRAAVAIPVLRKDFVIDAYQIYEARAAGADSFLLIAGVLDTAQLEEFLTIGRQLGMEPLIESHEASELAQALATSGHIIGINNRNLKSFAVDLETARALLQQAAGDEATAPRLVVCESGIKTPKDIELMAGVGYKVFLIGEALVTHPDPQASLRALVEGGASHRPR